VHSIAAGAELRFENGGLARRTRSCGRRSVAGSRTHSRRRVGVGRAEGSLAPGPRGTPDSAARRLVVALSLEWTPFSYAQPLTEPGSRPRPRSRPPRGPPPPVSVLFHPTGATPGPRAAPGEPARRGRAPRAPRGARVETLRPPGRPRVGRRAAPASEGMPA